MAAFEIELVTPERTLFKETVDSLSVPTTKGEITILPGHIPLVAVLAPGSLMYRKGKEEHLFAVSSGFVEIQKNRVLLLADTAEGAEELDIEKIEQAKTRAEAVMTEKVRVDDVSYASAAAGLERELARLRVARKHRMGRATMSSREMGE